MTYIFLSQIYYGITQYKLEKEKKNWLNSLCYGLPYYAKLLENDAPKLSCLKFKHGHLEK
jgi:hypothetical protein